MTKQSIKLKMWRASLAITAVLFVILSIYTYFYNFQTYNLLALSQAVAGTAAFMIGISFAMSGLAYFFNLFNQK